MYRLLLNRYLLPVTVGLGLVGATARADEPSVAVQHARVVERPISEHLDLYGRVEADPDAVQTVSLPHAGLITKVLVRLGQRVTQGSPLLELSTAPAEQMQYQQARRDQLQRAPHGPDRLPGCRLQSDLGATLADAVA